MHVHRRSVAVIVIAIVIIIMFHVIHMFTYMIAWLHVV